MPFKSRILVVTWGDILVMDLDILVPVVAHLFMPKSDGVHQFVDDDVKLQTSRFWEK